MINTPQIIKMLDSISNFNIYSKYGNYLKKIFRHSSVESMIKNLKSPIRIDHAQFIKDFGDKQKDEVNFPFNYLTKNGNEELDLFNESFGPEENDDKKDESKNNSVKNNLKKYPLLSPINKKQYQLNPFKYNPNYKAIYKNTPSFKILADKEYIKIKKLKKNKLLKSLSDNNVNNKKPIKKLKISINNSNNNNSNEINENNENNENNDNNDNSSTTQQNKKIFLTTPIRNNKNSNENKNNHALRFSKYIPRNLNVKNKYNDKLTYLEPADYSVKNIQKKWKNIINFKKMQTRNWKNFVNFDSMFFPSINTYNPKYDLVENKINQVIFDPKDITKRNKSSKKYLIKKVWSCFDVHSQYMLVDNDKLVPKENLK